MLEALIKIKNSTAPTAAGNTDPVMHDYKFFTDLEALAKKQREYAKQAVLKLATSDQPGVILKSKFYQLVFEESKPINKFELEKMIDLLVKKFPKDRVFIRECALKAVVAGTTKKTYRVERADG
jgi:hypothetical protein